MSKKELRLSTETSLPNGEKVSKTDKILVCTGSVEELITLIGCLKGRFASPEQESKYEVAGSVKLFLNARLTQIQENLHDVITSLVTTKKLSHRYDQTRFMGDERIRELEEEIEKMGVDLTKAKLIRFLPGVSEFEAEIFYARSVCRRVERQIAALKTAGTYSVDEGVLPYVNRIGDYFLALAVFTLFQAGRQPLQAVTAK